MRDCSQILTAVFFTFSIYFRNKKMYTISGLLFKRKEGRIMLETDTQLDDFKDDMIEITEEDMKKLSGGPDPDGDGDSEAAKELKDAAKDLKEAAKDLKEAANKKAEPEKTEEAVKKSPAGALLKILAALVVIGGLVCIFVFTGLKNDIVGTWEYIPENNKNLRMVFEFTDDGVIEAKSYMNNLLVYYDKGTYSVKSGYLICNWEGQGEVPQVEYEVKGDKLIFDNENQVFHRIENDDASPTDSN